MTESSGTSVSGGFIDREARAIFESITDAFIVLDSDWRIWYVNGEAARIGQRTASEFIGRSLWEEWQAAVGSEIECQYRRALREQTTVHFEHHYVAPGYDVWLDIHAYPFRSGLAVIYRDISHRKRSEEALRESEDRYRATFDNAAVGIAHVDLDGRWMRFNDAVCAITGYSREELLTKTFIEITHPDDAERDCALARRVAAGEIPNYGLEKRYIRKNGSIVWVNLTVSILRDGSGAPQHYIGVLEDISERKRAEAALQDSEERYRSLVLATSEFVWTADSKGEFTSPQPSWEAYTGQTWEEYKGSNWIAAVHPEDRLRIAEVWRRAVETCSIYQAEWRAWHAASCEWRHCVTRGVPVRQTDGQVREWIGAVTDVHERKLLDAKLQQDDKLDSLGVLAGGVAHDFNNLLVAIMGNASLALEDAGPRLRGMLQDILRASERAAELTQQMLAYAGKGQWVFELLDLSQQVRHVVRLVRSSLGPSAHLDLNLAENLAPIRGDRGQVQQIIMNLLINAGEALDEKDGHIRVATSIDMTGGRRVVLTVEDDGKGMTPEVKSRIFEPFFSTKFLGRGLGLAAVMGIVRVHGGIIDVDTVPGRGTTFRVFLPAADEEQASEKANPQRTVLVIDDEDVVLRTVENTLARVGIRTISASSGRQGIRLFQERAGEIDLVLLDVTMPDLGGRQVLRELRTVRAGIPVIASSGHSVSEVERYFGEDAPSAILPKPYKPEALTAAVRAHIRGGARGMRAAANPE